MDSNTTSNNVTKGNIPKNTHIYHGYVYKPYENTDLLSFQTLAGLNLF